MVADLQALRKDMEKHSVSMGRGDFEACRQLAANVLPKYPASEVTKYGATLATP